MWYPSQQQQQQQQQQQCWNGYVHHLSPQQQQHAKQTYSSRTSYYCNTDESCNRNSTLPTYGVARNDENESLVHYHSTRVVDDIYATGTDHYVNTSTGSYPDEMSSSYTNWNPVIAAPTKTSIVANNLHPNSPQTMKPSSPTTSSACWDWLLYPPEIYSHLYIPSSSFVEQQPPQDDELNLLASLPTWLLALLYPSMKSNHSTNEENDHDQEISSLNNPNHDEPVEKKLPPVSSTLILSSDSQQNRSSTPDTDDGYQSASDASRSDYSQQSSLHYDHHTSKDDIIMNVPSTLTPKRISYAAAVKPMVSLLNSNQKMSSSPIPIIKTKNHSSLLSSSSSSSSNEMSNNNGQKSKFIAPRFERMHHAKQHSTTTMTNRDSSSSTSSSTTFTNRGTSRSNNNHHQRNYLINTSRRR